MEKEQLHKKLDDFLSGSNKEKVDKELFSLLVRMDECRKKATPPDKDRMWEQVCRTLKHSRRRELVRRWVVAAAIVMPLTVGIWFYGHHSNEVVPMSENVGKRHQVSLTLNDGRVLQVQQWSGDSVIQESGTGILVSAGQQMIYQAENVQLEEEIFNTLSVPRSTEYQVQLSDGTRVWLNSESELRYPVDFVGTERKVFLKGEAYFQVAKDATKPFRVMVNDMQVEALGTEFNINAYRDDDCLRTTLAEGKVRVSYPDTRQECILVPGEQAVLKEGVITTGQVNVDDIIAWKKGRFVFSDMSLEAIAHQLERWYDVEIRFDDTVAKYYRFTGVMKRYNELEQVLGLIEETTNVRFKVEGQQVKVFRNLYYENGNR